MANSLDFEKVKIVYLGHAGFKLKARNLTIYLDPYKLASGEPADAILITHDHYDHCDLASIQKIMTKETAVVAPPSCISKLQQNLKVVNPNSEVEVKGISISVVPAYNPSKKFHPQGMGVGYVIDIGGIKVYHAGDTDLIPDMSRIQCDVALLPVSGTYTMNAREAVEAVSRIKPRIAIPMHWGSVIGSKSDAEAFEKLAKGFCEVKVLEA